MKSNIHRRKTILKYLTNNEKSKLLFLITILLAAYGSIILSPKTISMFDAIIIPFQFPIFNIFLLACLLLNTANTISILKKDFDFYMIRLETKETALKETITYAFISNLIYLGIFLLLFFSFFILFNSKNIIIHQYQNYNISNLSYLFFYLIRYSIIILIFSLINAILYYSWKEKVYFLNIIVYIGLLKNPTTKAPKSWLSIMPLNFLTETQYPTWTQEITASLLSIIVLEIIFLILYKRKAQKGGL